MKNDVSKIVQAIGGKDNITSVTHCVTRLRFILKDEGQVDEAALDQIDLVKGQFSANGQYQVIIGPGIVDKAYDELVSQTGAAAVSKEEAKDQAAQDLNPLQKLVKLLGDVFVPILPAIISSGLLLGINNVLTQPGIFGAQSIVEMYPGFAGFAGIVNFIAATSFIFI
ncbi:PTS transporter subunit EIIB, partial [Streptococcus danieliae]|nr:PTS transporter subunit EIIB [Streptococcus danieliae]